MHIEADGPGIARVRRFEKHDAVVLVACVPRPGLMGRHVIEPDSLFVSGRPCRRNAQRQANPEHARKAALQPQFAHLAVPVGARHLVAGLHQPGRGALVVLVRFHAPADLGDHLVRLAVEALRRGLGQSVPQQKGDHQRDEQAECQCRPGEQGRVMQRSFDGRCGGAGFAGRFGSHPVAQIHLASGRFNSAAMRSSSSIGLKG